MKTKVKRFVLLTVLFLAVFTVSQQLFAREVARRPYRGYYGPRVVERYYEPRPYARYNVSPYRRAWSPFRRPVVDVRPGRVYYRGPGGAVRIGY